MPRRLRVRPDNSPGYRHTTLHALLLRLCPFLGDRRTFLTVRNRHVDRRTEKDLVT
jgi:hypothetical protein